MSYAIYNPTLTACINQAIEYARNKGFETNDNDLFRIVGCGPVKPREGHTNRYSIPLYRDGKEQRKALHIQVYGMTTCYELNCYVN